MSKHTPGPWKAVPYRFGTGTYDQHLVIVQKSHKGDVCLNLAQVSSGNGIVTNAAEWSERKANAALIASAPDLLAALEAIMADYEAWQKGDIENPMAMVNEEKAIAAIKQARGQT